MKMHLDIEDGISPEIALECVKQVVNMGRISKDDTMYCYATTFDTKNGELVVLTRDHRKSDCFIVQRNNKP